MNEMSGKMVFRICKVKLVRYNTVLGYCGSGRNIKQGYTCGWFNYWRTCICNNFWYDYYLIY